MRKSRLLDCRIATLAFVVVTLTAEDADAQGGAAAPPGAQPLAPAPAAAPAAPAPSAPADAAAPAKRPLCDAGGERVSDSPATGPGAGGTAVPAGVVCENEAARDLVVGESGVASRRQWDLLSTASVTTLDPSKPQLALGFQYTSVWTLFRVLLRKDVSSNEVKGDAGDQKFGEAILNPALANIGGLVRVEGGFGPRVFCNEGECKKDTHGDYTNVVTRTGFRGYGEVAVSRSSFVLKAPPGGGTDRTIAAVPMAISAGVMFRLEGVMPGSAKFGSNVLVAAPYAGAGLRVLGGDFGDNERLAFLGSDASMFAGPEFGIVGQFGALLFDLRTSIFGPTNDINHRVGGVTGVQVQLVTTFVLPWNVLGGEEKKPADGK